MFILLVYFSLKATTADRQTEEGRKRERTGESPERETDRQTVGKVVELSANSESKRKRQNLLMLTVKDEASASSWSGHVGGQSDTPKWLTDSPRAIRDHGPLT